MFFIIKKKTLILYSVVVAALLCTMFAYAQYSPGEYPQFDGKTVIIDPGHGGIDGGAVGKNGSIEKDLNLALSLELKEALVNNGYTVIMTRETDEMLAKSKKEDTKSRLRLAEKIPYGLYIGIHMNSFEDASSKGAQIFYSAKNPQSKKIADILRRNIVKYADNENKRQIKEAYNSIYIMKNIKNPAILIECGFISNRVEEQKLNDKDYRAKIIQAIIQSIKETGI